jgi:glycosyltransferase involved in cell wall biosynthesis
VRALVLVSDRPWPPITGSRVRNAHLWPAVKKLGVEVTILGLDQSGGRAAPDSSWAGVELFGFDREPLPVRAMHALEYSYHEWPRSLSLARRVTRLLEEWRPDIVHAEELRMAAYLPEPRPAQRFHRTLTLHNVESDLLRHTGSTAFRFGRPLIEALHRRSLLSFERRAVHAVDLALTYSASDLARYRELYPTARWGTTRNGTNASDVTPAPQPREPKVLLVGSLSYAPNVEGLLWFLDRVLPRLPPEIKVTVAGSRAPDAVKQRLLKSRVMFVDSPPDLAPLYAAHALSAVPLFRGSGTRTKILEALAHERVVVSTTVGAWGLDLAAGEGLVLADDAESFAKEIRRLAGAPAEREEVAKRGRAAVLQRYDWPVVAAEFVAAWTACMSLREGES